MDLGTAKILFPNREALRVVAAAGRISTMGGSAQEVYACGGEEEKDLRLVRKVLSSGHRSVLEHQTFSIAFDNVSVLVEQFLIEFRLASFTVKSRRYVNFSDAGFVIPEGVPPRFQERMGQLFALYDRLLALGVPKEDARFVLPYCFRSNFYVSLNARELMRVIEAMRFGRGRRYAEIRGLGQSLAEQFEALYPGVLDAGATPEATAALPAEYRAGVAAQGHARLLEPATGAGLVAEAMAFAGREMDAAELVRDARPRELEFFQAAFRVENVSLACVTHFARHRMQSPIFMYAINALARGNYVLPQSVQAVPEARRAYEDAFREQAQVVRELLLEGMRPEDAAYCAMSGHTADLMFSMNGRELAHFFKLRTCNRAQWEIRAVAWEMLDLLRGEERALFAHFGPSCLVEGRCPEGRLSCGHPYCEPSEAKP